MALYMALIASVIAVLILPKGAEAQQSVNKHGWWLIHFGDNPLNDKIGLHTEVQMRNQWVDQSLATSLMRIGLNYYTSSSTIATVGYGYFYNEPSEPELFVPLSREHRIWQQFLTRHKTTRIFMEHRYRLEQRFVSFADDRPDLIDHRLRYRFQVLVPFYTFSPYLRHYFFASYNELMLNFRRETAEIFDRNRLYVALGYQVSPKLNFQMGYLNQFAQQALFSNAEINHLFQFTVSYNMDDLMATFFRRNNAPKS